MAEPLRQNPVPERVSLTDTQIYFQNIFALSLERLEHIAGDKETHTSLLEQFTQYIATLQEMQQIEGETHDQFTKRLGWAIQATAIELVGDDKFKHHPLRIEWKNELAQEVLTAKEASQNQSLPGMTLHYREPFKGYVDQYSHNRILVTFDGKVGPNRHALALHVGTTYHEQLRRVGEEKLSRQLQGYKALDRSPILWGSSLLNEIAMLMKLSLAGGVREDFRYINKRFSLLKKLVEESKEARKCLRVFHKVTEGFHALELQMENKGGELFSTVVQVQPEEVPSSTWEALKRLCAEKQPDILVPPREFCIKQKRRSSRFDDATDNEFSREMDEEDVAPGQKKHRSWLRPRRSRSRQDGN